MRSEKILILGLGGVGFYLAKELVRQGHDITIIEHNPDLVRQADSEIDARIILGDVMSFDYWKRANADHIEHLIAVTDNDSVNIMACMIADRFGIKSKVARIRTLEIWEKDSILRPEDHKIDFIIRPEELTAQEIARLITLRAGNVVIDMAEGAMKLTSMRIPADSPLAGKKILDVSREHKDVFFRIVAIARGITTIIPSGDQELLPGDQIFFMATSKDSPMLMERTEGKAQRKHRTMILGGGLIGRRVAQLLEKSHDVRLVEREEKRAEALTNELAHTQILHGDASHAATLEQAGVLDMNSIIAATNDNETNIMSCILAKHLLKTQGQNGHSGDSKTIALVNKEEYLVLAASMGSDVALNSKVIAGNEILKYLRRGKLLSMARLHGFDAEVVEIKADHRSPITKKPLSKQDQLRDKIIIGAYLRDGEWQIAVGDTQIQAQERVIAICGSANITDLQDLFLH
ncbi:Trk system potassium transporter TrkA [Desulfovibrio ferrophilus]|uniref:Trk system potassium uptake protein TrkA n=1 Tax=Desulfovibrio ferrophilus TaxID=241368 RepID=A0A2Z6AWG6_9BACT|nr:Trk system potassium transporter TrkA [Desulfovibrio ferrophilus]BBD07560.1 K+ transport system, NAD-binding component [Desulfovibrio ferrophilus]